MQAKLLRVLQERELERVGGNRTIKVDVRVIATTNRNLEQSVEKKEFRQDLFFRLNVVPDFRAAVARTPRGRAAAGRRNSCAASAANTASTSKVSPMTPLRLLNNHSWPGNVRELQNVVERAVILCGDNGMLEPEHLGLARRRSRVPPSAGGKLAPSSRPSTSTADSPRWPNWKNTTFSPRWTAAKATAPTPPNCST